MLNYNKSFMEVQFPVSKISKESYKERKANVGQTITGLGKWWGRKPLILVRSCILGLLMPVTKNPQKDREIFLKILSMDEKGLEIRKFKQINIKIIYEKLTNSEKERYFKQFDSNRKLEYIKGITKDEKEFLQKSVFNKLSYDEKLTFCLRPEEINLIDESHWDEINNHLGTNAKNLSELIKELGKNRFGHNPIIGDCFAGGGSIPFEAARIGANVFVSDLNPVSLLLNWSNLNILNKSNEDIKKLYEFQEKIYYLVDNKIKELETNSNGDRAIYYLYCSEAVCPECQYKVPLSPSWIIGNATKTIVILKINHERKNIDMEIKSNATNEEIENSSKYITILGSNSKKLFCPNCKEQTPIISIRKDRKLEKGETKSGLREWEKNDFIPRKSDIFTERLYCIKYENPQTGKKYYISPTKEDLEREEKVINFLKEKFENSQEKGYIPTTSIEEGYNTSQLIRERGWKYWYQLFNPRQLLILSLFIEYSDKEAKSIEEIAISILGLNKCCDWNSKLSIWDSSSSNEKGTNTFSNQALNTIFNYSTRAFKSLKTTWFFNINNSPFLSKNNLVLSDARNISTKSDIWMTDPPYADAVNYHELTEFFLAWDKKLLNKIFPDWYTDSKRALAVAGTGKSFNESMIEIYKNLANNMPDNGMQIVMFTHQDVKVWAELTLILWSSGLHVTSAWNIATETESGGLKEGNYVKGTVLLVLRKQNSDNTAFIDELYPQIESEVKAQIDSMRNLDDKEDPNFSDADYLLASYAASLKVLTSYKNIEDIDVKYELSKSREGKEKSPIEIIIEEAVKIAYDYLIPATFDSFVWKTLLAEERLYIKGLDLEKEDIYKLSAYQELARGFGVQDYKVMLENTKSNKVRLRTASEYAMKGLDDKFGKSLFRNTLVALHQSIKAEDTTKGKNWLKNEVDNYWNNRNSIIEILDYISTLEHIKNMPHWEQEAKYAKMLKELIKNDGI